MKHCVVTNLHLGHLLAFMISTLPADLWSNRVQICSPDDCNTS